MPKKPRIENRVHEPDVASALAGRIRDRRRKLGLSQAQVAEAIGLTFQQVQKYESGANRITVDVLFRLAPALNATPAEMLSDLQPADPRVMAKHHGRHHDMEHARLYADLPETVKPVVNQIVRTLSALPTAA
jgi:transcriptional regulator with XRE-family HTH domain